MTNDEFLNYCSNGYIKKVKEGLTDKNVDPSFNRDDCLRTATHEGRVDVVELLLKDTRIDPNVLDTICLRLALQDFDLPMIDVLLNDPRVDPSFEDNWSIKFLKTCSDDMKEILVRVSSDQRVINKALELDQIDYLPDTIKDVFIF